MKKSSRYVLNYTLMFALMAAVMIGVCFIYGKVLIWSHDDYKQDLTVLSYVGQRVRALISGDGIRLVDFSLGQGMDTLTTLNYYGFTDPLYLLGAFASENTVEYVYMLIAFLRVYLAGLFMGGGYLKEIGIKDGFSIFLAATVYAVSGFTVYMLGRFTYFINGAMYLPLVLTGVERLLKNDKPFMYILCAALMVCVNYYFAFMNTIAAIVYIIVRLVFYVKEHGVRPGFIKGVKLLLGYVLALALSAVILLPTVKLFIINSRDEGAGYTESLWHYSISKYANIAAHLFVPDTAKLYSLMPIALIGIRGVFYLKDKRALQIKLALLICAVWLCVPLLGKLMNGFNYASDRWAYIFTFFGAVACAVGITEVLNSKKKARITAVLIWLYSAVTAVLVLIKHRSVYWLIPVLLLPAGGLALWFKQSRRLIVGYLAVNVVIYSVFMYLPIGSSYIQEQLDAGVDDKINADNLAIYAPQDDDFYRISTAEWTDSHSIIKGYHGVGFYWSLIPDSLGSYYKDLGNSAMNTNYLQCGLSPSARLSAVADVRYTVQKSDCIVPYGYTQISSNEACVVYKNQNELALGYAFDTVMSTAEYTLLPVEQKLEAIVKCAVCDKELKTGFGSSAYTIDHTIEYTSGGITVRFAPQSDCEMYLILEKPVSIEDRLESEYVTAQGHAMFALSAPGDNFYTPRSSMALYLGSGTDIDSVLLPEGFSYESMRVVALPTSDFEKDIAKLKSELMTDVELYNNRVTGKITVGGERVLQIALPYSEGWTAYVDGQKAEVFSCGGMYMGVQISAGEHNIELKYVTPGLVPGAVISAGAALVTLALAVWMANKKRLK